MDLNSYSMEYELLHKCNGKDAWSQKILEKNFNFFKGDLNVCSLVLPALKERGGIQFMVGYVMNDHEAVANRIDFLREKNIVRLRLIFTLF
jgi:hypothetical protein